MCRRFGQNQTDCTFTVLALLPNLTENVLDALPVERLTHELQQRKSQRLARTVGESAASEVSSASPSIREGDSVSLSSGPSSSYVHASQIAPENGEVDRPRKSKAQLWNEIKISSITRAFTMLYTVSLLTLLTRIQLNLLGRLNYVSSVISLAQPSPADRSQSILLEDNDGPGPPGGYGVGYDFETNRRYLAFTWYLLNKGFKAILAEVQAAVTEIFGPISPADVITAGQLANLTLQVRQRVEGATAGARRTKNWLPYLLPPQEEESDLLVQSGVLHEAPSAAFHDGPSFAQTRSPPPSIDVDLTAAATSTATNTRANAAAGRLDSDALAAPDSGIRRLLDETADLIESPTFTRINSLLLDSLFSYLIEQKINSELFPLSPPQPRHSRPERTAGLQQEGDQEHFINPHHIPEVPSAVTVVPAHESNLTTANTDQSHTPTQLQNQTPLQQHQTTTKLATVLATLTRQAHVIGQGDSAGASGNNYSSNNNDLNPLNSSNNDYNFNRDDHHSNEAGNEYVAVMEREVRQLDGFAAVVFSQQVGFGGEE